MIHQASSKCGRGDGTLAVWTETLLLEGLAGWTDRISTRACLRRISRSLGTASCPFEVAEAVALVLTNEITCSEKLTTYSASMQTDDVKKLFNFPESKVIEESPAFAADIFTRNVTWSVPCNARSRHHSTLKSLRTCSQKGSEFPTCFKQSE